VTTLRAWIVAALGNEAPYLVEWIAHCRALGFEGAILFTHGAEDGTDRMAARLEALGHVRHVPLGFREGRDPLRRGLRGVLPRLADLGAEWAMVAGIDEYLAIRVGAGDLESLLAAADGADAISVCRKPFGCGGRRGLPDGGLRESLLRAAPEAARGRMVTRGLRTLVRPAVVERLGPHRPAFAGGPDRVTWRDAGGAPMPADYFEGQWAAWKGFSHRFARLHHYAVPSPETFVIRHGAPEDRAARKALLRDWRLFDQTGERDKGLLGAVDRAAPLLAELRADPELGALVAEGRAWHRARAEALARDEDLAALMAEMAGGGKPAPVSGPKPEPEREPEREPEKEPEEMAETRRSPRTGAGRYAPPPVRPVRFDVRPAPDGQSHAVLHGGFHKTATTSLQKLLEGNAAWLGRQSVYVVPHQKLRKHITFPSQLEAYRALNIHRRTTFSEEDLQGFADAFFAEPLALGPRRMILSDENIPGLPAHCVTGGGLYRHRRAFLACFAKRLPLPVTEAFFAVRDYGDFFASAYVEYLRSATAKTRGRMVTPDEMRRNVLGSLPNWQAVLGDVAQAFPHARLHVWRFEDFAALRSRILGLFCGEGVDVAKLKQKRDTRARPSASGRAVAELLLVAELEGAGAMAERSREIQERFPPQADDRRFDPWTEAERAHLGALYARDWQAIRADPRFSVLSPEDGAG